MAWLALEVSRAGKEVKLQESANCVNLNSHVDWFALGQVFRNIFENSIAACPEPGNIWVNCGEASLGDQPAISIRIRDNGAGIPSDARGRVFDAFFTTKTKGDGAWHGDCKTNRRSTRRRDRVGQPRARCRVRDRVAAFVSIAETGRQLVEHCEALNPDLVITDIKMPDMDGIEAAAAIYQKHAIPVILVSAFHNRELIERAESDHIMAYLVKPIKQAELEPAIALARK